MIDVFSVPLKTDSVISAHTHGVLIFSHSVQGVRVKLSVAIREFSNRIQEVQNLADLLVMGSLDLGGLAHMEEFFKTFCVKTPDRHNAMLP